MNMNEVKIGSIVTHTKFGRGVVKSFDKDRGFISVSFDKEMDGKKDRLIKSDFLSLVQEKVAVPNKGTGEKKVTKKQSFTVGDNVFSEKYGYGVVLSKAGFFFSIVKFESEEQDIRILNTELSLSNKSLITEIEEEVGEDNSSFKVIPSNYSDQSSYSELDKRLLTSLRRKYPMGGYATIQPYSKDRDQYGLFVVNDKGIVIFKMFQDENIKIDDFNNSMFLMIIKSEYEKLRNYYFEKFLNSKSLCSIDGNAKSLRYPMRVVFVYQNIDVSKISAEERKKYSLPDFVFFRNFSNLNSENLIFSSFEPFDKTRFSLIDNNDIGTIIERVVPENVTLIDIKPIKNISSYKESENPEFRPITGKEREYGALYLDDSQIRFINATSPGPHLTLANPGTGKSVLLLSKAYRIQSKKKDNHVLITCYNNNLAQHHDTFSKTSGLNSENLHICTFHKLVNDLLEKADPNFLRTHQLKDDYDGFFDDAVDRIEALVDSGKIATKLNAIFIDEVQLLEPRWIDICFKLLDRTNGKDYFFEMYGDINQDVKSKKKHNKASWQNTKFVPSLKGRTRTLDVNYRNTDLISNYLVSMITEFNQYLSQHGISIDKETACLPSHASKKGTLVPSILQTTKDDVSKIGKLVRDLVAKKKADYSDIAIIYPAKGYGKFYNPKYKIESLLSSDGVPLSQIHGDGKVKLFECDGVIMSTIDSCLGLDFKYVILCGIHFWDFIDEKGTKLTQKDLLFNNDVKELFGEIGKKIYSACSRAREGLYIIDDLDTKSPIKDIIRPKGGKKYYAEN